VLDEPTAGVDPQSRNAILESVERLAGEGIGVLYTTHYMEEAERLCDRVGVIDSGRLRAEGTRRELVALLGEHDRVSRSLTPRRPRRGDGGLSARPSVPARLAAGRRPSAGACTSDGGSSAHPPVPASSSCRRVGRD